MSCVLLLLHNKTSGVTMKQNFFEHNNRHYLRVSAITTVLRGGFGNVPKEILEAKATIGTEVHELCQQYLLGNEIPQIQNARSENYFNCFKKFCESGMLLKPTICEERFFDDELGITGQVDLVCPVKGSKELILVDLKTSASVEEELWLTQGVLYAKMVSEAYPELPLANAFIFLQLKEKGNAKVVRFKEWRELIPTFTSIVRDFMNENKEQLQEMLKNEQ